MPFSISYYSYQYTKSRIHREITILFICSFIFCWIRILNNNSGSRQKFRIHADPDPQHWFFPCYSRLFSASCQLVCKSRPGSNSSEKLILLLCWNLSVSTGTAGIVLYGTIFNLKVSTVDTVKTITGYDVPVIIIQMLKSKYFRSGSKILLSLIRILPRPTNLQTWKVKVLWTLYPDRRCWDPQHWFIF